MRTKLIAASLCIAALTTVYVTSSLVARTDPSDQLLLQPDDVQWQDGPDAIPPGAEIAVLAGDPTAEGSFTVRLRFPAEYRVAPHTHPMAEHVTVISGTLLFGMGREFEEGALEAFPAGSFLYIPPAAEHFVGAADEETVIQITGVGPWGLEYVHTEDDPRHR